MNLPPAPDRHATDPGCVRVGSHNIPATAQHAPPPSAHLPAVKLLIVSDDVREATAIAHRTLAMGYALAGQAEDGPHALRLASEHTPDLALIDVRLSGAMDAHTTAAEMLRRCDLPVAFLAADSPASGPPQSTPPFAAVPRPFTDTELRVIVERTLAQHAADLRRRQQTLAARYSTGNDPRHNSPLLSAILENTFVQAVCLDIRFNYIWVNRAYARTCLRDPDFFTGRNHFELYPHPENQASFQRVVDSGEPCFAQAMPFQFPDQPDRGITYWDWSLFPVKGPQGEVVGLVFSLVEVTDRIRMARVVESSRAELQTIQDHVPIPMFLADEQRRVLRLNRAALNFGACGPHPTSLDQRIGDLLGCTLAQPALQGCESAELCSQCAIRNALAHTLGTGENRLGVETRLILQRDGQTREVWVRAATASFTVDSRKHVLICLEDVTPQRQAEHALRESERRLRDMMENMHLITLMLDQQGRVLFANDYLLRLTACERDEILGLDWFASFVPKADREAARQVFAGLMGGEPRFHFEHDILTRTGGRFRIAWNHSLLKDNDGSNVGVASIGENVTERQKLEDQLRQAQKMEAIGQLAGGVAHDFSNVLAAIMTHLGLLQLDPRFDGEARQTLEEIEAEANRAANLTRQLLMFSRRSVMQIHPVDLNEVVANLLKMLRRLIGEHIQLRWREQNDMPLVDADTSMLEQVLVNLCVNARDAMPDGGELTVSLAPAQFDPEISARHPRRRPGRFACLSVADTGCGMDSATLNRLFEPFFTTKEGGKGTGLGLATVYGIVTQHKGWIECRSAVGLGSIFEVFLPTTSTAPHPTPPRAPAAKLPQGRETILLVEDETSLRTAIAISLRTLGYRVLTAGDGQQALDLWQQQHPQIDLVLTDLVMPGGITGLEMIERMRLLKPELKAIVSTGYSARMLQAGLPAGGQIRYLPKPYELASFAQALRDCLDQSATPATPLSNPGNP